MRVGDFLIGRGEVYVSRHNVCGPRHFIEVLYVAHNGRGRSVTYALHERGRRVAGTERASFGAASFLRSYRPATRADILENTHENC